MKILLIEDEPNVAAFVRRGLTEEGYQVSVAADGHSGLDMAQSYTFDLILLDLMLPGVGGLEICRTLRRQRISTPILMLTALGSTENIVTGLDSGADDYLVKPFEFAELQARIRTLSRRKNGDTFSEQDQLRLADLSLDTISKTARRGDTVINLTATEFRLLEYFMRNQKRVLSRMEILEHVWHVDFNMSTNVVDVYVNYLRKKIDKDFEPKLLHTVVGMGYVLKP